MVRTVEIKKLLLKEGVTVIAMSALTVALSVILSEIQTKVGWLVLFLALGTVLACFAIATWLVTRQVTGAVLGIGDDLCRAVERSSGAKEISWLVTTDELVEVERSKAVAEIWLISSDLAEDSIGGPFQKVVSAKLKAGVRYRYFVPDRPEMQARMAQLQASNRATERLTVTYLSKEFFFLVPEFDLAIYDPFNKTGSREAYLGIPAAGAAKHYHARIGPELVDVMIGKLMPLVAGEPSASVHETTRPQLLTSETPYGEETDDEQAGSI